MDYMWLPNCDVWRGVIALQVFLFGSHHTFGNTLKHLSPVPHHILLDFSLSKRFLRFFPSLGTLFFEVQLSVDLIMMGITLKSKILSPSRFALTVRKLSQDNDEHPTQPVLSPQHRIPPCSFSSLVELRHTEVWTRDHLEWFNVDFDPLRFHTIPVAFTSSVPINRQGSWPFISQQLKLQWMRDCSYKYVRWSKNIESNLHWVYMCLCPELFRKYNGIVLHPLKQIVKIGLRWVLVLQGQCNYLWVLSSISLWLICRRENRQLPCKGNISYCIKVISGMKN